MPTRREGWWVLGFSCLTRQFEPNFWKRKTSRLRLKGALSWISYKICFWRRQTPNEPARYRKPPMEMATCERILLRLENMDLVCIDFRHLVRLSLLYGCIKTNNTSLPSGGISTFGPLIVEAFGFSQFNTILFNIPFGAVQLVATLGGAWLATKLAMKGPVLILLCLPSIAGCVMLLCLPRGGSSKGALLAGYYIVRNPFPCVGRASTDAVHRFRYIRESVW